MFILYLALTLCFPSAMPRIEIPSKIFLCVFTEEKFCVCV